MATIVTMDDDDALRGVLRHGLEREGHTVRSAGIALFRRQADADGGKEMDPGV